MSIGTPADTALPVPPPSAEASGILIVDEDPAFQLGLKTFLREYVGFEQAHLANTAEEALRLLQRDETIEMVTLEYRLPGMDGLEFLEKIRESIDRPVSVVMITAHPSEELPGTFHSLESPFLRTAHFLRKPVHFEKLEPLLLRTHQDLQAHKRNHMSTELPPQDDSSAPTATQPQHGQPELLAKLEEQADRIATLQQEVASLRTLWRLDIAMLLLIAGLIWAFSAAGGWQWVQPRWEAGASKVLTRLGLDPELHQPGRWQQLWQRETATAPEGGTPEAPEISENPASSEAAPEEKPEAETTPPPVSEPEAPADEPPGPVIPEGRPL